MSFNRSLEGVILPRALESLTFGRYFNQTMKEVTLPDGLLVLTLGWTFNQSLPFRAWKESLSRGSSEVDSGQFQPETARSILPKHSSESDIRLQL